MSKRRTVKSDQALKANVHEHADQEKVMALFSPEQQKTIKQLRDSLNAISEASRLIGIHGSEILLEMNSTLTAQIDIIQRSR